MFQVIKQIFANVMVRIENREPNYQELGVGRPPGAIRQVDSLDAIAALFALDCARQKSESVYFSDNSGPPKIVRTEGGKLPASAFRIPAHLDSGSGYDRIGGR
jgi:hypothetical protein